MLAYFTAGESHGQKIIALIDGFPSGVRIDKSAIEQDLFLRSRTYGRSQRQKIENNRLNILSGIRHSITIGSPVVLEINNALSDIDRIESSTIPRPGHAEFAGALKYLTQNVRDISERASARETVARVAAGSFAKQLLAKFHINLLGYTTKIGRAVARECTIDSVEAAKQARDSSPVLTLDLSAEKLMMREIDLSTRKGDSVGGIVEIVARGVPPGLGSHTQWTRKLDARIAAALISVQAVKGVEFGAGFAGAMLLGSQFRDEMEVKRGRVVRKSNNAGGIEGGISNGEDIVVRCAVKPIPTTKKCAQSIDLKTGKQAVTEYERADTCAVPAAAIILESVLAFELASAFCEKFGSDSVDQIRSSYLTYTKSISRFWKPKM